MSQRNVDLPSRTCSLLRGKYSAEIYLKNFVPLVTSETTASAVNFKTVRINWFPSLPSTSTHGRTMVNVRKQQPETEIEQRSMMESA